MAGTVRIYKSTDASAPVLTGVAGALITCLDAILVNGYGSMTAAGWTKEYSTTNKAVYRMATTSNTGFYVDVNDAAPVTAKEAEMRGYEVMSGIATGTGPFPTAGQSSFGTVLRKSNTADSTARPWYCIADDSCFYFFADTGDFSSPSYASGFMFGDFFSYKAGDTYGCAIIGVSSENTGATTTNQYMGSLSTTITALNSTAVLGHYVARHWTTVGGAIRVSKFTSPLAYVTGGGAAGIGADATCTYPNGPDSALELAPVWLGHSDSVRGYLKGFWAPLHIQPLGHADTFSGTGNMAGKSFIAINMKSSLGFNLNGQLMIETSNTWS